MSLAAARRVAIAAQGLDRARPANVTVRQLMGMYDRIGLTQIDSVNVLARAHLLPAFSRLGAYDVDVYARAHRGRPPRLIEYWAHEAAYVTPSVWHWLRPRMEAYRTGGHWSVALRTHDDVVREVRGLVEEHGPTTARQMHEILGHERAARTHWGWNWTDAKRALETMFATGGLVVARRNAQFERIYDLPERVLGPLGPPPDADDAAVELVRIAARALGVATLTCLRDYFRMGAAPTRAAIAALVGSGELVPVDVERWGPAYLHTDARRPRRVEARALLAPFDPLVFERKRLESLFGMRYRIGIYTPAAEREHGYYVLPFLLDEQMAARVDLKADRRSGALLVRTAFAEPGAPAGTAVELAEELREMARWLGLTDIRIDDAPRGDLVPALARALS
ncbi:MAG: winged helix-turn-helix domain-containing protein [Propionibacterium sp.]|nr:winged helix-turn-helix domain-containing protein [Propionibacterium sp.]